MSDDDLIRRLLDIHEHDWRISFLAHTSDTAKFAAVRIEALAARVAKLEEALRPFAAIAPGFLEWHSGYGIIQPQWPDHKPILSRTWPDAENNDMVNDRKIYRSDFARAAAALQEERK